MKIVADTHTHTMVSSHAYSTVYENIKTAAKKGLSFLCLTDHGPALGDAPPPIHFRNLHTIPDIVDGIILLKGCEVNITSYSGGLDLPEETLKRLDWIIASLHTMCIEPASKEEHTAAWLAVARNPLVDVIGHSGDERFPFDHEPVIREFARHGKIVEINTHSFSGRPGSTENCPRIARLCKKYGVQVAASSDAHFYTAIGEVDRSLRLLKELDYPEELIVNTDYKRFLVLAREKTGRVLVAD